MERRTRRALTAVAAVTMFGALVPVASSTVEPTAATTEDATLASLPQVATGERPGPAVLYEPAPVAPQLENRHPAFVAPFDQVSGTDRYVDGEYLYTDHLWDDSGDGLSYPTDRSRFGDNAADLVELRISGREEGVTHYRFTLNTLLADDTTHVALAFDTDRNPATGSADLPGSPGAPFPGTDAVLSTWGTGATWSTWDGGTWATQPLPASVDLEANQITVSVPDTVAEHAGTWRATLAVGLHDAETGGFLAPQQSATADRPGGGAGKPAIFNLGFRFDEAILSRSAEPDADQSDALADREPTRFAHDIDLDAIASRASATTVPDHGTMVRFFPSRLSLGEGRGPGFPALLGQLQAYSLYVPSTDAPDVRSPLTLNLHSLGQRHWQYNGSTGVQQLGEQRGSLVATADARGTDGWYQNEAEYDVFEMWNDIARHFTLDPDATAITGYSMGGYATYRLGTLYPDLFGAAVTVVGPPGDGIWVGAGAPTGGAETLSNLWLENARNVPYMNIVAAADELVPITGTTQQSVGPAGNGRTSFDALGYRYAFDVYPAAEHLTLAVLGYDLPQAAEFLGDAAVDRNPFHVTFAYTPAADDPALGLVHDKAYWVSDVVLADPGAGVEVSRLSAPVGKGVVDVESLAFGIADPAPVRGQGGGTTPLPYAETNQTWGAPPEREAVNGFELRLTNVGAVTLDLARARLSSAEPIELRHDADSDAVVTLVDADGTRVDVAVPAGAGTIVVDPAAFGHGDDGDDPGEGGGRGDERRCVPDPATRPRGCVPAGGGPG